MASEVPFPNEDESEGGGVEVHGDRGGKGDDDQGVDVQGLGVLEEGEVVPPAHCEELLSPLLLYK